MAYVVDCCRIARGKKGGKLSKWHPADLGAQVVNAIVDRNDLPPELIDDLIFGCVSQIGAQAGNIARSVVLSSKLPETVPGTTVDRQCGSAQQAIHFAAQAVLSETQDLIIAGGVEVMSLIPIGSSRVDGEAAGRGNPMKTQTIQQRYPNATFANIVGAELLATKYQITREEMEQYALNSHQRAFEATRQGVFKREIIPLSFPDPVTGNQITHETDEGIRWPADISKLSKLPPLEQGGRISAALASQITDGAAAVLLCNEKTLKKLGLKPRARIVAMSVIGDDPILGLGAPIPATFKVLQSAGLTIDQIDLYEVNEAFASVPLAWAKAVGANLDKLNVNGGAIALGHPLGATGAIIFSTLLNELERRNLRFGLQAICERGGLSNAIIIERLSTQSKL
jgi:acetyl-CoA acetyltransferase family protein